MTCTVTLGQNVAGPRYPLVCTFMLFVLRTRMCAGQGNIRVHARIRPATTGRVSTLGMTDLIQCNSEGEMWLKAEGLVGDHRREAVRFEFDAIHQPYASQEEVFAAVKPLCESVLDGYNITLLAYGQVSKLGSECDTPPPRSLHQWRTCAACHTDGLVSSEGPLVPP